MYMDLIRLHQLHSIQRIELQKENNKVYALYRTNYTWEIPLGIE